MSIEQSLNRVRERIAEAALRAGRLPDDVALIAVSKTFPAEAVLEALAAGQQDFGENRVEEALAKKTQVSLAIGLSLARWHLIGHVQSRKAKDAVGEFELIHSVDSYKLAEVFSRRAIALAVPSLNRVLLECNVSGEASKEGFDLADWQTDRAKFEAFAQSVAGMLALPQIQVCGLMTIAPIVEQAEQARPVFASLRALRDALRERFPTQTENLTQLSMGMSDDFEIAIAEGSTMVRLGRAIFGGR